jgi:ribonuclease P protein component
MGIGNNFKKDERLSLNNRIEDLFALGFAISIYPLKILWIPFTESSKYPAQVMFVVSSKRFKKAVDRNRIKRKLKEVYRLQKSFLYEELMRCNKRLLISIIYIGNDLEPLNVVLSSKLMQGFEMLIRSCNAP